MIEKFQFEKTTLPGAYLIRPFYADDLRGGFIKDYNIDTFRENGLDYELKEVFYTVSHRGVIRALHFQLGRQQPKLVRCISGHVYDVIADLRPGSPTFGQWEAFDLTGDNRLSLISPLSSDTGTWCWKIPSFPTSAGRCSSAKAIPGSGTTIPTWPLNGLFGRSAAPSS